MPDYIITVTLIDVAEGDAQDCAQEVWDEFAGPMDAEHGDFNVTISRREGSGTFDTGWEPDRD